MTAYLKVLKPLLSVTKRKKTLVEDEIKAAQTSGVHLNRLSYTRDAIYYYEVLRKEHVFTPTHLDVFSLFNNKFLKIDYNR